MDPATVDTLFKKARESNVVKTLHQAVYPAISPTRPELSQSGRTILVTGGGTGVGFSIARAFIRASADTVIIIGRRADVLAKSAAALEELAKSAGTNTKVIARTLDITDLAAIEVFWKTLAADNITVDVFVSNAAKFTEPKPILELGADEVWSQMEINVKSPLYLTEKFYAQGVGRPKFIVNVTSGVIHTTWNPIVHERPAYVLSKLSATALFQLIALSTPVEKLQIVSFHPGLIWGDGFKAMGLTPDLFDDDELCGAFTVWAASTEAAFMHGRYALASWDVEELATGDVRKRIENEFEYLKASVVGVNEGVI